MYKINVWLFFKTWNFIYVCSLSISGECGANNNECLHSNIFKSGEIVIDKCLRNSSLLRLQDISFLDCITAFMVTSMCTSINYRKNWNLCDLNGISEDHISEERECVYTEKALWPNTLRGKYTGHNCNTGSRCQGKLNKTSQCQKVYCTGYPKVRHATLVERFGIYRKKGHAIKYKCKIGLKMIGRPFAVCQKAGNWKTLFVCGSVKKISERKLTGLQFRSSNGVDGDATTYFHTNIETNPYWWVDLGDSYSIVSVVCTNRGDCCGRYLINLVVYIGSTLNITEMAEYGRYDGPGRQGQKVAIKCTDYPNGNYVKLVLDTTSQLHLAEVEVYGVL